jgi:hypothetical protein
MREVCQLQFSAIFRDLAFAEMNEMADFPIASWDFSPSRAEPGAAIAH